MLKDTVFRKFSLSACSAFKFRKFSTIPLLDSAYKVETEKSKKLNFLNSVAEQATTLNFLNTVSYE